MSFKKTIENFKCEHCSHENVGSGFTDHCKKCLWSKHVDVDPGDREATCWGMMKPIESEVKSAKNRIKNKCLKCGFERFAPILTGDNFDEVLAINKKRASLS